MIRRSVEMYVKQRGETELVSHCMHTMFFTSETSSCQRFDWLFSCQNT